MMIRGIPARAGWVTAIAVVLAGAGTAGAQAIPPLTAPPGGTQSWNGGGNSIPGLGGSTGGWGGGGGSGGVGSAGMSGLLPPAIDMAILMDSIYTVEGLLNNGQVQVGSELEILLLVLMVYDMEYAAAVEQIYGLGSGGTANPLGGITGTTGGTGGTTGTTVGGTTGGISGGTTGGTIPTTAGSRLPGGP